MAVTLPEYAKGLDDLKARGVVSQFAMASDILGAIPFKTAPGGAYRYNVEEDMGSIQFRAINETTTESHGVLNEYTEQCYPMAGNLDVDRVLLNRHGMERRSHYEVLKIKKAAAVWTDTFLSGDRSTNPKEFQGLQARLTGTTTDGSDLNARIYVNSTTSGGGPLSLSKLDQAIANVNSPTHLIMSRQMKTKFIAAARDTSISGHVIYVDQDDMGMPVVRYGGLPVLTGYEPNKNTQILPFTEADYAAGGTASTSIYVVNFSDGGVCGLETRPMEVEDLGLTEAGTYFRTNVEHDTGMCVENEFGAIRLNSITNAAIVA